MVREPTRFHESSGSRECPHTDRCLAEWLNDIESKTEVKSHEFQGPSTLLDEQYSLIPEMWENLLEGNQEVELNDIVDGRFGRGRWKSGNLKSTY